MGLKIAFVTPWYGANISGGTESACRNLSERLRQSGVEVYVLTTCVKQFHSDWNVDYHKPGLEIINGVHVLRFSVRKRNVQLFDSINAKLMKNISVSLNEEDAYLAESVNSPDLEKYLLGHKEQFDAFIFTPYMFGTTYHGVQQVYDKAILFPAFHDESYAYFTRFKEVYSRVKGIIFNSIAEQEWAAAHYNFGCVHQKVIGLGVTDFKPIPGQFREKYKIPYPFILYAGRRDDGKNVDILVDFFNRYKINRPNSTLKLVLIGGGGGDRSYHSEDDIYDLGFVTEEDKYNAYGAAQVLCNPSSFESFSLVIMESWQAKRPVLVYEKCEVTKRFVEQSNGGLYFCQYDEFEACLDLLLTHLNLGDALGNNGYSFVQSNFTWDCVIENYQRFIEACMDGEAK
ncbi:glycosyltransferase family 4 protein [Paenibacillus hodogayensis]|uniref:Glycosyltransferase family 4 protein n=1 Tax=Paenibacillus hodogayensis TaxID=279208 RepID=A0ABV5VRZ3_9BACL